MCLHLFMLEHSDPEMLIQPKYDFISEHELINFQNIPAIVLTKNLKGFFSWGISKYQAGSSSYTHCMGMIQSGWVAGQNWRFEQEPITNYINSYTRIKVWYNPEWTAGQVSTFIQMVQARIKQARKYDWLGILGQWIKIKGIEFRGRDFCSEAYGEILNAVSPEFQIDNPSPGEMDVWLGTAGLRLGWKAVVYDPTL